MSEQHAYVDLFNRNIHLFFQDALRISLKDPAMALFLYRALRYQNQAAGVRASWEARGVHVPPFMIASITHRCNLHCKGCYARAQHRDAEPEMSPAKLRSVIGEARDLGVSIILLAGGEPLTRPEILDVAASYPEVVFPLFTNGLLLTEDLVRRLRTLRNIVPVLSLEGHQVETDGRRGPGVYQHVQSAMALLKRYDIFYGVSLTVTSLNLPLVTDEAFVRRLLEGGSRVIFYVDYVPVQPGTEALALDDRQRAEEARRIAGLRERVPGQFVAFPGDEDQYGGCLAAGRGFVHISPEGRLEPCPFAPYSDASLKEMSLRQALQSPFLQAIREADGELQETRGGCALWAKRAWVSALLEQTGAPALEEAS